MTQMGYKMLQILIIFVWPRQHSVKSKLPSRSQLLNPLSILLKFASGVPEFPQGNLTINILLHCD
ncbi:hypothetical protein OIU78_000807 [Salix suchowensis]|nr:hypothetical protein OIU78_000807 [Salix suchowensis]